MIDHRCTEALIRHILTCRRCRILLGRHAVVDADSRGSGEDFAIVFQDSSKEDFLGDNF